MEVAVRQIVILRLDNGASPFEDWLNSIKDSLLTRAVDTRIARIRDGNFGGNIKMKTEDYRNSLFKRLKDPEYAVGYLTDVLAEESQEAFLIALRDVIESRSENFSALSEKSGITRQGLYQALSESGNPHFATIREVLNSLGLQLTVARKQTLAA